MSRNEKNTFLNRPLTRKKGQRTNKQTKKKNTKQKKNKNRQRFTTMES